MRTLPQLENPPRVALPPLVKGALGSLLWQRGDREDFTVSVKVGEGPVF